MTRYGVLRHAALHPHLVALVARLVDCHARLVIVDARHDEVDRAAAQAAVLHAIDEHRKHVGQRNVAVQRLKLNVWIDVGQRAARGLGLGETRVLGPEKEAVHVGDFDLHVQRSRVATGEVFR